MIPLLLLLVAPVAHAWEKHEALMPYVVAGLPAKVRGELSRLKTVPCSDDDEAVYAKLAQKLRLNPKTPLRPTATAEQCKSKAQLSPADILSGMAVDDPDNGMDRDLPYPDAEIDVRGDRFGMGGKTGPTSQGFRHMYFGGWKLSQPIATFQVPTRAQGQSPDRTETLATEARELIRSGQTLWGFRVLAWAMHFVQDLSQPFHSVQIPSLSMVPWYSLLEWPPSAGFHSLVKETTRTISNYHWAFEQYNLHRIQQGDQGPYVDCLLKAEERSRLVFDPKQDSPRDLAFAVADRSLSIAARMGQAVVAFFGGNLKLREFDLPNHKGTLDYPDLAIRPDLTDQRQELQKVSCEALANGVLASRKLVEWALQP